MICAAETSWAIQLGTDGLQVRSLCVPLSAGRLFELSSGSVCGVTAFGVSLFYAGLEFSLMLAMWLEGGFGLGNLGGLALPILFFGVMYFLMIVPNQKKQKKWQEMLGQLKSGDTVTTNGGIRGKVLTVKDDAVIVRVQPDGVKLEFVKSAIAAVTTDEAA
jgi:preprotein translocase subunit YajC